MCISHGRWCERRQHPHLSGYGSRTAWARCPWGEGKIATILAACPNFKEEWPRMIDDCEECSQLRKKIGNEGFRREHEDPAQVRLWGAAFGDSHTKPFEIPANPVWSGEWIVKAEPVWAPQMERNLGAFYERAWWQQRERRLRAQHPREWQDVQARRAEAGTEQPDGGA